MPTIRYTGQATAVIQVDTVTIGGTPAADSTFTITVTGENGDTFALVVVSGTTDVDVAATTIATAWNASSHYLLEPVTAAGVGSGGDMTLTADTSGEPFDILSVPVAKTDGTGTPTIARAATTASAGPFDWNDVDNWDSGALPQAGDDIIVEDVTVLYGLDQTGGNTPDSLTTKNSQIGQNPPAGVLSAYLQIDAPVMDIGNNINPGTLTQATPVMIDTGTAATNIIVYDSGTNSVSYLPAVWLKINENTSTLEVRGGIIGLGYQDESMLLESIIMTGGSLFTGQNISTSGAADPKLVLIGGSYIGGGVPSVVNMTGGTFRKDLGTITTFYCDGGTVTHAGGTIATLNMTAGTLTTQDRESILATITTINQRGGTVNYNSTGTITTANIFAGNLDLSGNNDDLTIETLALGRGSTFKSNAATTILTNDLTFTTEDGSGVRTVSVL